MTYQLVDSGDERKLERFGDILLSRPCSQAVWKKQKPDLWSQARALFTREEENKWIKKGTLPESWTAVIEGLTFKISPTDFGHVGAFPEHSRFWPWIRSELICFAKEHNRKPKVLNLFAYSGGATLAAAQAGAEVCHLDSSKGMTLWARENAVLNSLQTAPIRWIVDDVMKFVQREIRRENRYDAIILDPPTFGRGASGELFQIEKDIVPLLDFCKTLLSDAAIFILFSCHTPGFTPMSLSNLMHDTMAHAHATFDSGEMFLPGHDTHSIPSGAFCRWQRAKGGDLHG